VFGHPNPGAFEAALRCQNTEAKGLGPANPFEPNSMGEQGSASLRRQTALHFWFTPSKMSMPFLPPTGSWARGHDYRIWHPPIMLYLLFSSGPLDPPLPLTSGPCNPFPAFLFFYSSVQYTLSATRSFLWSQACHQGSQPLYLALPRNALFVLSDSSHTSCKHGGKLSDCPPTFTSNSAENSQSRDGLLLGLPTIRRRARRPW